jgi:hypothetical protein
MEPPTRWEIFKALAILLVSLIAALPIAARLRIALPLTLGLCSLVTTVSYALARLDFPAELPEYDGVASERAMGHATHSIWLGLIAVVLVWTSRDRLTNPWDARRAWAWSIHGLRDIVRADRWSFLRLTIGIAVVAASLTLYLGVGAGLESSGRKALARVCAGILTIGAGLILSCFRIGLADPPGAA